MELKQLIFLGMTLTFIPVAAWFGIRYRWAERMLVAGALTMRMAGDTLVEALLGYGISAISLSSTGQGVREGIRACVSQTGADRFHELARRLSRFQRDHQAIG